MKIIEPQDEFLFIVDTNQYSGNFEREMGSYLTGVAGEYFSIWAEELSSLYKEETGDDDEYENQFEDILGCHEWDGEHEPSYVSIWSNEFKENSKYNGYGSVALIFDEKPTKEQLDLLKERSYKFPQVLDKINGKENKIKILGTYLLRKTTSYSEV